MAGLIEQYTGRTVTLLAFQPVVGKTERLQALLSVSGGYSCTGIEKLAQRFLLHLTHETGSNIYFPDKGCLLLTAARQGSLRSVTDIQIAYTLAMVRLESKLRDEETDDDPDDERFAGADLTDVVLLPGAAKLSIDLYSLAGTSRTVIAPLPFVPI